MYLAIWNSLGHEWIAVRKNILLVRKPVNGRIIKSLVSRASLAASRLNTIQQDASLRP